MIISIIVIFRTSGKLEGEGIERRGWFISTHSYHVEYSLVIGAKGLSSGFKFPVNRVLGIYGRSAWYDDTTRR
jgi:hypothetical protein